MSICNKKIVSIFLAVILIMSCLALSTAQVSAASWHSTNLVNEKRSGKSNFKNTWKRHEAGSGWTFSYGFNTFAINEDTVTGKHKKKWHKSSIIKGGKTYSATAEKNVYGNREIRHTHSTVSYKYYSLVWK